MTGPWMLLLAIGGIAVLYVLMPMVAQVFAHYRKPRVVRCPETGAAAQVQVDAWRAAKTSVPGPPELRVMNCSRWPERMGCDETCVAPGI
jgi:hypothetical protein